MLKLAKALSQGDFVEIGFQTKIGAVIGMAEMLHPARKATDGILQPFRFIALGDDDHRNLRMAVQSVTDQGFLKMNNGPIQAPKSMF